MYQNGFAATRREARQLVNHGHFLVNGKKANIPSMELKAGDVITVKEKSQSSPKFKELKDMVITTPQWISIDLDKLEGKSLQHQAVKTLIYQSQSTASLSSTQDSRSIN